jgi:glycosyltransferase involved in cell wall biosynthesis
MKTDNLYIVIPAYNEEMNISNVVKEWYEIVENIRNESRLVVIDDGSLDNTYTILKLLEKELSQLIVIAKKNEGHGATILYGYNYALENNADYIFQTDSDGQTLPSEFWKFWEQRNNFSAMIGFRNHRKDGLSRIFITKILKLLLLYIFGEKIIDANTPFRLINNETLKKYIKWIPHNFNLSNILLTVYLVKYNENIAFLPITFQQRQAGKSSIKLKNIFKIGIKAISDFKNIRKEMEKTFFDNA